MRVGFTYNLKKDSGQDDLYAEWDNEETIDAVLNALAIKHEVIPVEADLDAFEKLRLFRPDIVFNIAEGLWGPSRESQIPAMLEMLQIPYTGSDPLTLGLCLEKARAKELLSFHHIPNPGFLLINNTEGNHALDCEIQGITEKLAFPLIVKPSIEGSSKGIGNDSVVCSQDDLIEKINKLLSNYRQPVLIEEFLQGREFTVAIWGNGDECQCLPIVELKFDALPAGANPLYSYEAKWVWDTVEKPLKIFQCPAQLDSALENEIRSICLQAFKILRCRDWCRIDLRLNGQNEPHILELNPLPGILPNPDNNSCFPKAARAAGYSYEEMINRVVDIACQRWKLLA